MDLVLLGLILSAVAPTVWNKAILELKFIRYINHAGTGENGHCCDGRGLFCFSKCDHRFVICVDKAETNRNVNRCLIGRRSSNGIDNANVNIFGDSFGGVRNPMIFSLDIWDEKAQLKVDVFDVDDNQDDKVDFLYGNFTLSAAKSKKLSREQSFRLATAKSILDYKASVYCQENIYGPACDVKCVDHDDTSGHYTCDSKSGQKVCLDGWSGVNCDKNLCGSEVCGANQTCTNSSNGEICECKKGFQGENCTEPIPVECYDGFCKNNGSCIVNVSDNTLNCICDIGWKGETCEEEHNPCEFNPCLRNGTCVYTKNVGYVCECPFDSQGEHCENVSTCVLQEDICLNGGSCVQENLKEEWYFCDCPVNFTGKHCETLIEVPINETSDSNITTIETTTIAIIPSTTIAPKATVILRGKVDSRNEEAIRKALMKIIHDFTPIKGELYLEMEKEVYKTQEGEILTEIGFRGTADGKPFSIAEIQRVLSDSHAVMVDHLLPIPRDLPDKHSHSSLPSNAAQDQIQHDGWIHQYWFVVLLIVLAIVALVMFITFFIIIRRKKSLEELENKANVARTSSTGVTESQNAQSFENSLYFEMNQQKKDNNSKVNFKAMP